MAEPMEFFTRCAGRYVSGSHTEKRTKDNDNRPIDEDKQNYEFGVAFDKQEIWPQLSGEVYPYLQTALSSDANALQRMQGWFQTMSGFSMKISDGDKPNQRGQVNENTKGCFVIWFSSRFPPTCCDPAMQEIDAQAIKRGYYVQVAGTIVPNGQPGNHAGVYMNGNFIRLVAEGPVITGGGDPSKAFGDGAMPSMPAGAQPLGSNIGAPSMPGNAPSMPGGAPAPAQTGTAAAPSMPGTMPGGAPGGTASPTNNPHTDILTGPPLSAPGT